MSRRFKIVLTTLLGAALIVCGYGTWERIELPWISYNNTVFVKSKTLTFKELQSENDTYMHTNFIELKGKQIHGYPVYIPIARETQRPLASFIVTVVVLKEGNNEFVVYDRR